MTINAQVSTLICMETSPASNTPTPQPVATTTPPPAPIQSTFSTPPEKSSKFGLLLTILIVLILITAGMAAYYFFMMNKPATETLVQTQPTQAVASPTPTIDPASDEALNLETDDVEINISELENQANQIQEGLAEPTPNLQ